MAASVVFIMLLPFLIPSEESARPVWLVPSIEGLLLVALIAADPGRIDRRATWLRRASIVFVALLVAAVAYNTMQLIHDIVTGAPSMNNAATLLRTGAVVWLGNCVSFALLYWELDS